MPVAHGGSAHCRSRTGFEHWTLRCASCRLIREAQVDADPMQVDADPMKSDAVGWEHSDLRVPQQGR